MLQCAEIAFPLAHDGRRFGWRHAAGPRGEKYLLDRMRAPHALLDAREIVDECLAAMNFDLQAVRAERTMPARLPREFAREVKAHGERPDAHGASGKSERGILGARGKCENSPPVTAAM